MLVQSREVGMIEDAYPAWDDGKSTKVIELERADGLNFA